MIVAVDRENLRGSRLLNETCSVSIICVSFSLSSTKQDSFIRKDFFVMGGDKEIIPPSNTASWLLQWPYGELCGC